MNKRIAFIRIYNKPKKGANFGPPLGIASLISFLKSYGFDFEYDLFDTGLMVDYKKEILRRYRTARPIVFGISSMLRQIDIAADCAEFLKKAFPEVPVVIGGPIVTSLRDRIFEFINADYAVYKEGEVPFLYLIKVILQKERKYNDIPSLIYRDGERVIINPDRDSILSPGEIPLPDLEAINIERYFSYDGLIYLGRRPHIPLITSRGCPYGCTYCHNIFGRSVRMIDKNKIVEYCIRWIDKFRAEDVEIYDDIFNVDEERARFIINEIYNHNNRVNFLFAVRTDILTDSFIDFMGTHNIRYIAVAIETGSERIQKLIKKRLDLKKAKENVQKLSKYPILLHGLFMLGFPTETKNEIEMTIDYALNIPIHTASFLRVLPYPGTEIFSVLERDKQDYIMKNLSKLSFYSNDINVSNIDTKTLNRLRRLAFIRFYLRPSQILRISSMVDSRMLFDGFLTFIDILREKRDDKI